MLLPSKANVSPNLHCSQALEARAIFVCGSRTGRNRCRRSLQGGERVEAAPEESAAVAEDHHAHDVEPDRDVALAEVLEVGGRQALEAFAVGRVLLGEAPDPSLTFAVMKTRSPSSRPMKPALSLPSAQPRSMMS